MKQLYTLALALLVPGISAQATTHTLSNGNFSNQTSAMTIADGDIIKIPAGANVSFTATNTINHDVTLEIRGNFIMTSGTKTLTLDAGSVVKVYPDGSLSGASAAQRIIIGTNNIFTGDGSVGNSTDTFTATGSSMGFITSSTPLPLKFLSFDASLSSSQVSLNWSAVNDGPANAFMVQQSTDGKSWSDVAMVKATGGDHEAVSYTYQLEAPKGAKTAIYRIRYTGKRSEEVVYSSARAVNLGGVDQASPTVVVSATAGDIKVQPLGIEGTANSRVFVTSVDGRVIYDQALVSNASLSIPARIPGMYIVTISDDFSYKITQKVMVQ